jgi:hypothetical protein
VNVSRFSRYDIYVYSRVNMSCLVPMLTCVKNGFEHNRLYMNLTGHTFKGFEIFKSFSI